MLDTRVATLEVEMREVRASLARIETTLRSIDERLRTIEVAVAETKGRVSQIPNAWQLILGAIALVGMVFGAVRFGLR